MWSRLELIEDAKLETRRLKKARLHLYQDRPVVQNFGLTKPLNDREWYRETWLKMLNRH